MVPQSEDYPTEGGLARPTTAVWAASRRPTAGSLTTYVTSFRLQRLVHSRRSRRWASSSTTWLSLSPSSQPSSRTRELSYVRTGTGTYSTYVRTPLISRTCVRTCTSEYKCGYKRWVVGRQFAFFRCFVAVECRTFITRCANCLIGDGILLVPHRAIRSDSAPRLAFAAFFVEQVLVEWSVFI